MKNIRIVSIILLIVLLPIFLYAHDEPTHQYIIREAYKLFENQCGVVPELKIHIGTTEGRGNLQFQSPFVVGGAWSEDQEDAIYGIGFKEGLYAHISGFTVATLSALLSFPYAIPAALVTAAYTNIELKKGLVSVSHFWDADNSIFPVDNVRLSLSNTAYSSIGSIGAYPNAYKKAKAYLDGGFDFVEDNINFYRSKFGGPNLDIGIGWCFDFNK